jgi:uncharacterized protein with von Willebrand factor type A (vWA) domain
MRRQPAVGERLPVQTNAAKGRHHMRSNTSNTGASVDLPTLAAVLSQRLHAAGLPVTPDRTVRFAQALRLVGPVSDRQLYWTARAVFVSAHAEQPTFDRVFASVFGCADAGAPT